MRAAEWVIILGIAALALVIAVVFWAPLFGYSWTYWFGS